MAAGVVSPAARWRHMRVWPQAPALTRPGLRVGGDVAVAVLLGVGAALMDVVGPDHQPVTAVAWDLALAAPLALRRTRPTLAAVLVGLVCLGQWLWWRPVVGDLAVLVALFTLAAHGRRRGVLVLAVVTAEVGVLMAVGRWAGSESRVLPTLMLTGTVTASWVAGIYVRTHRAWTASLRERAETAERERDQRARVAVADERSRIARELHDVVAHSISVMVTLNDAAVAVGPPGQARDTVAQASDVGRHALEEMSRLLGVLREEGDVPVRSHVPQPGLAQLDELVDLVRSAGLDVRMHGTTDRPALLPSVQLAVYRIVQESLTNVLKHGRNVTRVDVTVRCDDDGVDIVVADDGDLGEPPPTADPHSLGLVGIRERAAVFAGRADAGPVADGGWQVTARLRPQPSRPRPVPQSVPLPQ